MKTSKIEPAPTVYWIHNDVAYFMAAMPSAFTKSLVITNSKPKNTKRWIKLKEVKPLRKRKC